MRTERIDEKIKEVLKNILKLNDKCFEESTLSEEESRSIRVPNPRRRL